MRWFRTWMIMPLVYLAVGAGILLAHTTRADEPVPTHTAYLSRVEGNPQLTAPTLPVPFRPPGVVYLPQLFTQLPVGDTLYVGGTSAARSDPTIKGAVVVAVRHDGVRVVWDADQDTGLISLVVEGRDLIGYYVTNADGAGRRSVIVAGVR